MTFKLLSIDRVFNEEHFYGNLKKTFSLISWEGKKVWHLNFSPLIKYLIRSIFMEKSSENVHQKLVPDPFIYFGKQPKTLLHAINSFKIKNFERWLSKTFKKITLFLLSNPVPFNGQSSRSLELVTCRSSGYETSSQKILY